MAVILGGREPAFALSERSRMMIKAIVFLSNTGSTARYAGMAAKAADLPAYPLSGAAEHLAGGEEIFFMGWVMQGKVRGYGRAAMRYSIPGVCGVGMSRLEEDTIREIRAKTGIRDTKIKVFYAQSGFDMEKLHPVHRLLMKNVVKTLREREGEEARELLNMIENGADYTEFPRIAPVVEWIKRYNRRSRPEN